MKTLTLKQATKLGEEGRDLFGYSFCTSLTRLPAWARKQGTVWIEFP